MRNILITSNRNARNTHGFYEHLGRQIKKKKTKNNSLLIRWEEIWANDHRGGGNAHDKKRQAIDWRIFFEWDRWHRCEVCETITKYSFKLLKYAVNMSMNPRCVRWNEEIEMSRLLLVWAMVVLFQHWLWLTLYIRQESGAHLDKEQNEDETPK